MYYYYLYSKDHINEQNEILSKRGKHFIPGVITIGGSKKQFSKKTSNMDSFTGRYLDAQLIAEGEDKNFTVIDPKTERN